MGIIIATTWFTLGMIGAYIIYHTEKETAKLESRDYSITWNDDLKYVIPLTAFGLATILVAIQVYYEFRTSRSLNRKRRKIQESKVDRVDEIFPDREA